MNNLLIAPEQVQMSSVFDRHPEGMLVKQTMRGCLQECFGCEATSEYNISGLDFGEIEGIKISERGLAQDNELYAIEKSAFLCRCCWRDGRSMLIELSEGKDGPQVAKFEKACGCPLYFTLYVPVPVGEETECIPVTCPCCCFLPALTGKTADGNETEVNYSEYICDQNCCVPKFRYSEGGTPVYVVKPPTCCGDCCIKPRTFCGRGGYQVPFVLHDANTMEPVVCSNGKNAQITKLWAGFKKECCSTADNFATLFPDNISQARKAGLLGLTLLIDFTIFERQGQARGNVGSL